MTDETIAQTPTQVAEASRGNAKFWLARVLRRKEQDGANGYFIQTESWQEIKSGESAHVVSTPRRVVGKNIGRTNETTERDQAIFEMSVELRKKQDAGYHEIGAKAERRPLPMLAHKFEDRKHGVSWPCWVQPKIDGVRMLFDGKIGWTRKGKWHLANVVAQFACDIPPQAIALDGELVLPPPFSFQDTISAVKRVGPNTPKLQYCVYDFVPRDPMMPYAERLAILEKFFVGSAEKNTAHVPTVAAKDEKDVWSYHDRFVEHGFEGAIVRNGRGIYKTDHRSADLLKVKTMTDSEFDIVSVEQGVGKDEGMAILVLRCDGGEFRARPEGSAEYRRRLWSDRAILIGKQATCKYQNLSDGGIPRFPVVTAVRDYE